MYFNNLILSYHYILGGRAPAGSRVTPAPQPQPVDPRREPTGKKFNNRIQYPSSFACQHRLKFSSSLQNLDLSFVLAILREERIKMVKIGNLTAVQFVAVLVGKWNVTVKDALAQTVMMLNVQKSSVAHNNIFH